MKKKPFIEYETKYELKVMFDDLSMAEDELEALRNRHHFTTIQGSKNYVTRKVCVKKFNWPEFEGSCPKCNEPWKDHEFGVPEPYCPVKKN